MISEKFRLDHELYEWVTARFRSQLQDLGGAFLNEREAFDRMNVRRTWWTRTWPWRSEPPASRCTDQTSQI